MHAYHSHTLAPEVYLDGTYRLYCDLQAENLLLLLCSGSKIALACLYGNPNAGFTLFPRESAFR